MIRKKNIASDLKVPCQVRNVQKTSSSGRQIASLQREAQRRGDKQNDQFGGGSGLFFNELWKIKIKKTLMRPRDLVRSHCPVCI